MASGREGPHHLQARLRLENLRLQDDLAAAAGAALALRDRRVALRSATAARTNHLAIHVAAAASQVFGESQLRQSFCCRGAGFGASPCPVPAYVLEN